MTTFPETLKTWRAARRVSQLELAMEADVSSRHLSFLETGRAQPSRDMIARLSEALRLPLDARNQMLTNAGFAVRYPERRWDSEEMAPIRRSVDLMLAHHMPFPGIAVDRIWTVMQTNAAASRLFGQFGLKVGGSLLDLMMSEFLPPMVENWPEVARHAAERLRTESAAQGGVTVLDRVAEHLSKVGGASGDPTGPVIPTILRLGENRLSTFATIAQFGTPADVTLSDLKVELYFPMDNASEALLKGFAAEA